MKNFAEYIKNYTEGKTVCILGFGRCVEKPAVYNGEICIRTRMVLSVTYDHRVFDGGEVGRIMKTMKEYLEDPELLLSK